MRAKYRRIFSIVILWILCTACGLNTPTPDLQATLAIALQHTVDAYTPTPTSTHTPTPTVTSSPTPTLTPSLTPTITPTEAEGPFTITLGEDGWKYYHYQEFGFSIGLPPKWTHLDLNAIDLESMLSAASEKNPELASIFSSEYIKQLATAGIKMIALDTTPDSLKGGISTNLNILVSDLPFDMDFEDYVDLNVAQIKNIYGVEIVNSQERIQLGEFEAAILEYETVRNDILGKSHKLVLRQYLILNGRTQYVLTFTNLKENYAKNAPLFDEIASSFEVSE